VTADHLDGLARRLEHEVNGVDAVVDAHATPRQPHAAAAEARALAQVARLAIPDRPEPLTHARDGHEAGTEHDVGAEDPDVAPALERPAAGGARHRPRRKREPGGTARAVAAIRELRRQPGYQAWPGA
jgi:hypothetical protein